MMSLIESKAKRQDRNADELDALSEAMFICTVHVSTADSKSSFENSQLEENARAFVDSVVRAKPATAKGNYIHLSVRT